MVSIFFTFLYVLSLLILGDLWSSIFSGQLLHGEDTTSLGLSFIMTMSEELASPTSDFITSQRREELSTLMKQQVPTLLSLLMNMLDSIAERQQQTVTPTPPPSPNVSPIKHRCVLWLWVPLSYALNV